MKKHCVLNKTSIPLLAGLMFSGVLVTGIFVSGSSVLAHEENIAEENIAEESLPPPPPPMMLPPGEGFGDPMMMGGVMAMGPGAGGEEGMILRSLSRSSSFTDDQLEKIYKAKESFMDKSAAKMAELKVQERALNDALTQADLDKSKVQNIQSKINGLKADLNNLKLEQKIAILDSLTPEQRKELRRFYIKAVDFGCPGAGGGMFMHHMKMRRHHGGGPGGGACGKFDGDCEEKNGGKKMEPGPTS